MSEFADLLQLIAGWSVRCGQCPQRLPKPLLCLPPLQNISNFNFQQLHKGLQQPIRPLFYFFFALLLPFVSPFCPFLRVSKKDKILEAGFRQSESACEDKHYGQQPL